MYETNFQFFMFIYVRGKKRTKIHYLISIILKVYNTHLVLTRLPITDYDYASKQCSYLIKINYTNSIKHMYIYIYIRLIIITLSK